ncbi:hypothetical protein VKT23_012281 [Stygiomarasmius scandens]|uniref:DUF6589 domain-containing protein n=1 Tax=Marasmiellus scandens TaxID=2682957 RepID=A0ABR1JBH8_9AGAR
MSCRGRKPKNLLPGASIFSLGTPSPSSAPQIDPSTQGSVNQPSPAAFSSVFLVGDKKIPKLKNPLPGTGQFHVVEAKSPTSSTSCNSQPSTPNPGIESPLASPDILAFSPALETPQSMSFTWSSTPEMPQSTRSSLSPLLDFLQLKISTPPSNTPNTPDIEMHGPDTDSILDTYDFPSPISPIKSTSSQSKLLSPLTVETESLTRQEHIQKALKHLGLARLTPAKLLLEIISAPFSDNYLSNFCSSFFREDYQNITNLLDTLWKDEKGKCQVESWIMQNGCAIALVESLISQEFENVKSALHMKSAEISLSYIEKWDVSDLLDSAPTPMFTRILKAAEEGKIKAQCTSEHLNRLKIRPGAPQKVQTGTFPLLYQLFRAHFEDMKAAPMRERFWISDGLSLVEIMPSPQQQMSYYQQLLVHVIRVLPHHHSQFSHLKKHPFLEHKPHRALPEGHKTQFYPLHLCMIEEASVEGNICVHDNVYIHQLKMTPAQLSEHAIPLFADQLTLARTRSVQCYRAAEKTAWE